VETIAISIASSIFIGVIILSTLYYIKLIKQRILFNTLEHTRSYALFLNKSNKITKITEAACNLLGADRPDLVNKHLNYIFQQDDKFIITQTLKKVDKQNVEILDDVSVKTKAGVAHVLCKIVKLSELSLTHDKCVILQDRTAIVSKTKKVEAAEKQIKEYAELLQSSFDDSFMPSILIDEYGCITNYNKSFHALVKKVEININQDSIFDILQLNKHHFEESLKTNKCFEFTVKIQNQEKNLVFNLHKIKNSKDKQFTLCQIQDITKQKQAETIRKKLENQIKQARKVEYLGELAGMVSHEFNNALMPIISFSNSVEKSLPETMVDEKDKLKKVIEASKHARDMINQIMSIKHIDFKETEVVDLAELTKINQPKFNLPENIELVINDSTENAKTMANYDVLGQAMQNVVKNATQGIGKEQGQIIFNIDLANYQQNPPNSVNKNPIKPNKDYYRFEIKDTGMGIKPEDMENIFNPFFTTKHFGKQIGTGLTYVYNCMERYQIPLEINSKPDEGVSIVAFFPAI
jgi:signal transduction histidine kinase